MPSRASKHAVAFQGDAQIKTNVVSLLLLVLGGSALADPPASQPSAISFYNCQLNAIGDGTLDVHVLRGRSGIIHPVNVDEKTVVILLNGQPGKLSDLKVGQWIKVYWKPDAKDPNQQRIVKIEPGMPPWAAQRLADLENNVGKLDVAVRVFINGKGDEEELHFLGPDNEGGFKEPFFARLTKGEMTKLIRYMSEEGFLADAIDGKRGGAMPKPLAAPYVNLVADSFYQSLPLTPDTVKRLEGIKAVLPDQAAAKLARVLANLRKD